MELYLPPVERKRKPRPTIVWTDDMINRLKEQFPIRFNKDLAKELGVSLRSLIRKAREHGIWKEDGFLKKNKNLTQAMAVANYHSPYKGMKGWCVPNSLATRFKPGNIPPIKTDLGLIKRIQEKRNQTIKSERIRIKLGLQQKTKLKLLI
jgi:hypothetical protein